MQEELKIYQEIINNIFKKIYYDYTTDSLLPTSYLENFGEIVYILNLNPYISNLWLQYLLEDIAVSLLLFPTLL